MNDALSQFIIDKDATLKDALIQMTSTHRGVLLVTDSNNNLVGVLADGDVRRSLLDDVSLKIPISQIMNLNPVFAESKEQAEQILDENPYYILVPIVNKEGKLEGVFSALDGNGFYEEDHSERIETNKDLMDEKQIKYLAVIPARGGSKRIPDKNLSKIADETLLSLAIQCAKKSSYIDHIIVSTDSKEIAKEAEDNGVNVPWLRPDELSGDTSKTVDVLIHALGKFKEDYEHKPKFVILLEPTAPLRSSELIDEAIKKFEEEDADSLVSVNKIKHIYHPEELLTIKNSKYLKPYLEDRTFESRKLRGQQKPLFIQNGLVYITRSEVLNEEKSIYGKKVLKFETSEDLFADIDVIEDLELARMKFKKIYHKN